MDRLTLHGRQTDVDCFLDAMNVKRASGGSTSAFFGMDVFHDGHGLEGTVTVKRNGEPAKVFVLEDDSVIVIDLEAARR